LISGSLQGQKRLFRFVGSSVNDRHGLLPQPGQIADAVFIPSPRMGNDGIVDGGGAADIVKNASLGASYELNRQSERVVGTVRVTGGMVCKKTYKRTYYGIAGYATPSYIEETTNEQVSGNSGATLKSNEEVAEECIKGLWGNGNSRKSKLTKAGYDYEAIRAIINNKLKGGKK